MILKFLRQPLFLTVALFHQPHAELAKTDFRQQEHHRAEYFQQINPADNVKIVLASRNELGGSLRIIHFGALLQRRAIELMMRQMSQAQDLEWRTEQDRQPAAGGEID